MSFTRLIHSPLHRGIVRPLALRSSLFHSSAFQAKASIVEWGYGSTQLKTFESNSIVPEGPNKTWIAAGASHRLISLSGEDEAGILGSGMNHSGQLGSGVRSDKPTFSAIDTSGMTILGLACGREHSMLLTKTQYDCPSSLTQPSASAKTILFGFGNS
ncbi:hypothetical protein BGW38_008792, partial [Lunasporangiospora selenospora]